MGDVGPTGFGTVTYELGSRLIALGEDVRFISQNDLGGVIPAMFIDRTLSMPSLIASITELDTAGTAGASGVSEVVTDLIKGNCKVPLANGQPWGEWQADAVVMLGDFAIARQLVSFTPAFADLPTWHYCPIEGRDLPPLLATDLWAYTRPVAMSNFGADEIAKVIGFRPPMIYHGVDTNVFHPIKPSNPVTLQGLSGKPVTIRTREECKQMWGTYFATKIPGRRLADGKQVSDKWMLRTDRHMPRKLYNAMLRALTPVLALNAEAVLIIHCAASDFGGNLPDSVAKMPGAKRLTGDDHDVSKPESWSLFGRPYAQVILTNTVDVPRPGLVTLYNTSDVYVSTSAEGFGLTIAEALACGVPAVGLDYSAVPEVIGPAGKVVAASHEFDNIYDHKWAAPDEALFGQTVHQLLNNPEQRQALGRKGPRHIRATFSWDAAASQFADLIRGNVWPPSPPSQTFETSLASPPPLASSAPASSVATSS